VLTGPNKCPRREGEKLLFWNLFYKVIIWGQLIGSLIMKRVSVHMVHYFTVDLSKRFQDYTAPLFIDKFIP